MKPASSSEFERNRADAATVQDVYETPMIRTQMNGNDWLILASLAVIWGGAFFFIGVAVRHVPPLTYVGLRLTIAAAAMWAYLRFKRQSLDLPRSAWASILLLALLNNALPFTLFGWGQTHIASGLASILNATTPIWGVVVAHFLTHDERMTPRKIAGV
ncbi:MAG TPA: DMT family transporter, partial [Sphingomicrobium sp.]